MNNPVSLKNMFVGLSLKAGTGNVGMGTGNGESLKWGNFKAGIFKMGNL